MYNNLTGQFAWASLTSTQISQIQHPEEWVIILPIGAVEQHGPHLPIATDSLIIFRVLEQVCELLPKDSKILILPTLFYGTSDEHLSFSGTLSLSPETLARVLDDISASVARSKFKRLLILNAHGGNPPSLHLACRQIRIKHKLFACLAQYFDLGPTNLFSEKECRHGIHGGAYETSVLLHTDPELCHKDKFAHFPSKWETLEKKFKYLSPEGGPTSFGWITEDLNKSGVIGNPNEASPEHGHQILLDVSNAVVELIDEVRRIELDF
eukprot:c3998_g1_i1.p1 GENE.c3998_g1_i1~~c3998_g1_i1.p1  ORF type:complete len:275 (+),score=51.49 c3998_g1_i1:25-825(+)